MPTRKKTSKSSPPRPSKKSSRIATPRRGSTGPAAWYIDIRDRIARQAELDYLIRTTRDLRKVLTGFKASDGYDLHHPERWSWQRVHQVKKFGGYVHSLMATPHKLVYALGSKKRRIALGKFTGQAMLGKHQHRAYVVHDEHPDTIDVSITRDGQVEIIRDLPGVRSVVRTYLFVDYGFDPRKFVSFDDHIKAIRYMLKKKILPDGYYQFWGESHGVIGLPMERDDLILNLNDYGARYSSKRGFPEVIIGLRFQGDEISAEVANTERQSHRRRSSERKYQDRLEMSRRVTRARRLRGF